MTMPAKEWTLEPDDIARIERTVPPGAVAGARYDAHAMAQLDSERGITSGP